MNKLVKLVKSIPGKLVEVRPNFMIIGAQKCGTTSMFSILEQHSYIRGSRPKELHYFDNDTINHAKYTRRYHSNFRPKFIANQQIHFEASPSYLSHKSTPKRLFEYNPDLKLIILLRDPAKRALSAWNMYHERWKNHPVLHEKRSFSQIIDEVISNKSLVNPELDPKGIILRGIYHEQVQRIYQYFPKNQVHILSLEQFQKNHKQSISDILNFLRLPYQELSSITKNSKEYRKSIHNESLEKLSLFYRAHNESLFHLIGKTYDWSKE